MSIDSVWVTPCLYESSLARYNSFWVMPALLGARHTTFPRLETKLDPSCEYETLKLANDEKDREVE